jgi:hypothetical protein
MSDEFSISVDTRAMEQALIDLGEKVAKKALKTALQAAGDTMLEPMVELAPEHTEDVGSNSTSLPPGMLKADLHTDVMVSGSGGNVRVGPSMDTGHVARWINNGWTLTSHGKKRSRHAIRDIPGKHFLEAAFDESSEEALHVFLDVLSAEIAAASKG